MAVVLQVIAELEGRQISREELETTRLGKHINQLRRTTKDDSLARRLKNILRIWREKILSVPAGTAAAAAAAANLQAQPQHQQHLQHQQLPVKYGSGSGSLPSSLAPSPSASFSSMDQSYLMNDSTAGYPQHSQHSQHRIPHPQPPQQQPQQHQLNALQQTNYPYGGAADSGGRGNSANTNRHGNASRKSGRQAAMDTNVSASSGSVGSLGQSVPKKLALNNNMNTNSVASPVNSGSINTTKSGPISFANLINQAENNQKKKNAGMSKQSSSSTLLFDRQLEERSQSPILRTPLAKIPKKHSSLLNANSLASDVGDRSRSPSFNMTGQHPQHHHQLHQHQHQQQQQQSTQFQSKTSQKRQQQNHQSQAWMDDNSVYQYDLQHTMRKSNVNGGRAADLNPYNSVLRDNDTSSINLDNNNSNSSFICGSNSANVSDNKFGLNSVLTQSADRNANGGSCTASDNP